MKLAIISHTIHHKDSEGEIVGWGPTVREINYLSGGFEKIIHVAPLHNGDILPGCMPYKSDSFEFVSLKPSGGSGFKAKLSILIVALHNIRVVRRVLKDVDVYQFRAPTGMGVYLIPWLYWFSGKKGWVKYAGNWQQIHPPMAYAIQRWLLKKMKKIKVTINGNWIGQPKHCISFENPCLTEVERASGKAMMEAKDYNGVLNLCFIGRLDKAKGADIIIEAIKLIATNNRIGQVHFIGDSKGRDYFYKLAEPIKEKCVFHGFVQRVEIASILSMCHIFVLPSESEGFPKAIAEAANFGCIPVVSDISCIGQYVKNGINGYLIPPDNRTGHQLASLIDEMLKNKSLNLMAREAWKISETFTFEYYSQRIIREIVS